VFATVPFELAGTSAGGSKFPGFPPGSGYRTAKRTVVAWTVTFRRGGKFPSSRETSLCCWRPVGLRGGDL